MKLRTTLSTSVATLALGASLGLVATSSAAPGGLRPAPAPPEHPTSVDQIQNIDQVRTAIKGYYGDTPTDQVDPYAGDGKDVKLHTFAPDSAYAQEVGDLTAEAGKYLARRVAQPQHLEGRPAIILDIDDTTLTTYNYEVYSNFAYDPTVNAAFVNAGVFPAVPTMPQLTQAAAAQGYELFFLTGRPENQRPGTQANLTGAGYAGPAADHLFLKDQTLPWLSSCAPTCSSAQYKALTREHLEKDLGYDVVANFGDQPSDFTGGFADRTFRVPNPMYYLP
ncbi:HAD family acid phosphatase [Nocardioides marmoribigeumensis]|uniref:Acid phosphatase n=1 Tax=Nocardioides marmoribigeumensis TaxID=433649 RepID=A0ABU2BY64_9ACTN|nr:HAD family acid phosphatase [Nocardioides marmoribigeumensis]MDR7363329.1 hypothetical protein [Nocardioides marmoribigeumensis]